METAIYARISLDREGEGLGVQRQLEDCRAKCKALGWTVSREYVDNDLSASSGAPRPEYQRMLADLEAGSVKAVVVYDLDRLTRRPAELEGFIDLAESKGISLANVSGDVDLTTASGRMVARIKGAVARQESDRIGERVKRQKLQRAESGKPQGSRYRVYGYTKDWQVIPAEAAVVREMFERRAAGESTTSIANDLSSRGITTVTNIPWRSGTLSGTLAKPGYAGLRQFKSKIIGKTTYPAIIDEALFNRVHSNLTKDSRGTNTRKHLLSGFLVCSKCFTHMKGNANKIASYKCSISYGGCGGTTVKSEWTDSPIIAAVFDRHALASLEKTGTPKHNYESDLAVIDAKITELQQAYADEVLDLTDLLPLLNRQRSRRKAVLAEAARTREPSADEALDNIPTRFIEFQALPLSQQRAFIDKYIAHILVYPRTGAGRQRQDNTRLEIHWKGMEVDSDAMQDRVDSYPLPKVSRLSNQFNGRVLTDGMVIPVTYTYGKPE